MFSDTITAFRNFLTPSEPAAPAPAPPVRQYAAEYNPQYAGINPITPSAGSSTIADLTSFVKNVIANAPASQRTLVTQSTFPWMYVGLGLAGLGVLVLLTRKKQ